MEVKILKQDGSETSRTAILNDEIFNIQPNDHAIWLDVKRIQANKRRGLASTKERNQVKGSRRKLYRQKGTGRARKGDIKSPILRGGGVVFGPHPRDYSIKVNKKVKVLARKSALSYKAQNNQIIVIDDMQFDEVKTKKFKEILANLNIENQKILFVLDKPNYFVFLSAKNLQKVKVTLASQLNTYDILNANLIVFNEASLPIVEEILLRFQKV
ncbi:MAG: 50S ribosomal protein L4 [Bacteroidales bacterium]|jgi:large subunit ribosomal protein L4|nr:50S ribosomal protein L4 [Bacteroidales bacterium]MDI9575473.1 50S ribosomal protein L4 [Bacteroidota bacterium]MDD2592852.1 50S ribosomal protein L4 [Bacteroidales bacterium]MDD3755081.1 50S ribosomal protein L4 [Bacteroidales bacterium]MDY0400436.1 50S ribosomal protein L4 [Bacteroidales bacterium]